LFSWPTVMVGMGRPSVAGMAGARAVGPAARRVDLHAGMARVALGACALRP